MQHCSEREQRLQFPPKTTSDSWKLVPNGKIQLLGEGAYGYVFKATVQKNGMLLSVAVKTIKPNAPKTSIKVLWDEIQIMKYIGRHKHVSQLLAGTVAQVESNRQLVIVLPVYENGSLLHYLRRVEPEMCKIGSKLNYSTSRLVINLGRWISEICKGMEYLVTKRVVHCDLASRNILLDGHCTAKISDFGLSRQLDQTYKDRENHVAWRWAAIETMVTNPNNSDYFTEKSDVWAFGVTMWEIFSFGAEPYSGLTCDYNFLLDLKNGNRLGKPVHANTKYYDLMLETWKEDPNDRPTFKEITEMLPIKTDPYLLVLYSDILDGFTYSNEFLENIEDTSKYINSLAMWTEVIKACIVPWSPFISSYCQILTQASIQSSLLTCSTLNTS